MNKIIYQDSNEELLRSVAANGEAMVTLIETDTGVKSAASQLIDRNLLEEHRPTDKNHVLIHLIGMGNSQQYGYNRNGDWFDGPVLEKRAYTFVTNGHMFREHRNKDPKDAIGSVKYAGYDPKGMQRVEILVHLDRDKDPEGYEMAKKGSALNFSMSCRVPNDRCSCCGNEAKTISNYCDCLKHHMGQWMPEFNKYAFAYNDAPTFFDISKVKTPADRIARHLEYLFDDSNDMSKAASVMCKAASAGEALVPSAVAAMAEGINLDTFSLEELSVLHKLASAEEYIADSNNANNFYTDKRANACYGSYPFALLDKLDQKEIDACRAVAPTTLFREMGKKACLLSFPAFCQYITGNANVTEAPLFKKAALMLPDVFRCMTSKMMTMAPITNMFEAGSEFSSEQDPRRGDLVQDFMDKAEDKFSVRAEPVKRRVMTIIIKAGSSDNAAEAFQKAASLNVDPFKAQELAETYGQYQLRALCDMHELNAVDSLNDNVYDLVAGANSVLCFDR